MDERISCDQVNALTPSFPPRIKRTIPVNTNALATGAENVTRDQVQGVDGFTGSKQTDKGCVICNGKHIKLYNCKHLPKFIPGKTVKPLPKDVCDKCLYCSIPRNCHKGNESFICKTSGVNQLLCSKCPVIHQTLQAFFKSHHNSDLTIAQNMALFKETLKPKTQTNSAIISASKITPKQSDKVLLNECPLGQTTCLSEVIRIKQKDGEIVRCQVHYDNGSMNTLMSDQIGPLAIEQKPSKYPIELYTVCGRSLGIRQLATVKLTDSIKLQGIVLKNLSITNQKLTIPPAWDKYLDNWSLQPEQGENIDIQILIGCDRTQLHPTDLFEDGKLVETQTCRIKTSKITGKFMGQGFYVQPNIKYNQTSQIAPDQMENTQLEKSNSSSEDDILQSEICKAHVYVSEANNEDTIITL